jgi:hypothetical protein
LRSARNVLALALAPATPIAARRSGELTNASSALCHSLLSRATKPLIPFSIAATKGSVADAIVGTPTSAASKNLSSLFASQNGLPGSSGARLMSVSPIARSN